MFPYPYFLPLINNIVFQGSRVQQIQRYWLTRIKATLFYTHFCLFFSLVCLLTTPTLTLYSFLL